MNYEASQLRLERANKSFIGFLKISELSIFVFIDRKMAVVVEKGLIMSLVLSLEASALSLDTLYNKDPNEMTTTLPSSNSTLMLFNSNQ